MVISRGKLKKCCSDQVSGKNDDDRICKNSIDKPTDTVPWVEASGVYGQGLCVSADADKIAVK